MGSPDLMILGLDGASFRTLDAWMSEGWMPSLRILAAGGARAVLRSVIPPYTPQAWTTLATGLDPGRHGIAGFTSAAGRILDATAVRAPRVWDILAAEGWRTGTLNVPLTYPARGLPGFQISGMLAPNRESPFAEPAGVLDAIRRMSPPYVIDFVADKRDRLDPHVVDRLSAVFEARLAALSIALEREPVDFLFVNFVVLDRLQHLYWKYLDPAERLYRTPEAEALRIRVEPLIRRLDSAVGDLASRARLGTIVVSDHGFLGERGKFYTNRFLEESGLLALRGSPLRRLLRRAIGAVPPDLVRPLIPKRWIRRGLEATERIIDRDRSLAFASAIPGQGIHFGPGAVPETAEEIIERLRRIEDPHTEGPLVRFVERRERIYRGDRTAEFPDIVFLAGDGAFEATPALFKRGVVVPSRRDDPGGTHHRDGVFIAAGKLFRAGVERPAIAMSDVLPTLLAAVGLRREDLDGDPRLDVLSVEAGRPISRRAAGEAPSGSEGPPPADAPPARADEEEIRRRLQGLGYL
ncbi:MAG: alkaline phosphatase family protein [Planctomycetes bacterium]|nr:alkaline phosphatase family protein [Planctomycetota bacterium]